MALKGFPRKFKPLEILTEEQVEAIHKGTLEVLWVTGVRVEHEGALKLCEKNGCRVDYDENRVRIPPDVVEECIRRAPSSFHTKARDSKNDLMIGGDTLYLGEASNQHIVDLDTWEPRMATRKENYDNVKVSDALLSGGGNCTLIVEGDTELYAYPHMFRSIRINPRSLGISIISAGGSDLKKMLMHASTS